MLQESNSSSSKKLNIPVIQKYLFWGVLFLLPIAIMPFPWDWTERSMSLLILSLSTIILGLQVVQMFWDGKLSILRSSFDLGMFSLLLSLLLSTIFSKDINSSI